MSKLQHYMLSKEILNKINTPAPIVFDAIEAYKNHSLHFAMNASIEITRKGRIYTCWIGGEDGPESYMIVTYSDDSGKTWRDIQFVVDPHSDDLPYSMNTHVGGFWLDPDGKLWLFYQQSLGMWDGAGAVFALVCDDPDAEYPQWNKPFYITPGSVIKKPIVLSNGEWLLPVSIWERWHITTPLEDSHHEYDNIRGANVYVSQNKGKSWEYRGGVAFEDSCFHEHSIVELSNGDVMMMSRCRGSIKRSFSADRGKTWSPEEEYFKHVTGGSSMATLRKLSSGNLLLIKHGTTMDHATTGRSHLTAFISKDDGKTFEGGLLLDERGGISYPDICESSDGTIYVQYDYKREQEAQLLFACFKESDVLSGAATSVNAALRRIITSHKGITGTLYTLFEGAADGFSAGSGSREDPYLVSSAAEYIYLAQKVYEGETFAQHHFLQTADIDFGGKEVVPIGAIDRTFNGSYDGNSHYLKNLNITGYHLIGRGLFSCVCGATVKNIKVKDATFRGKEDVAAIIGIAVGTEENPVTIENCVVESGVCITAYTNAGGVVGRINGYANIIGCENRGDIRIPRTTGGKKILVGGIAGAVGADVKIAHCENRGNITVRHAIDACIGGIVGGESITTVANCTNVGDISLDMALQETFIGGIVGKTQQALVIEDCVSTGKLTAENADQVHIDRITNVV